MRSITQDFSLPHHQSHSYSGYPVLFLCCATQCHCPSVLLISDPVSWRAPVSHLPHGTTVSRALLLLLAPRLSCSGVRRGASPSHSPHGPVSMSPRVHAPLLSPRGAAQRSSRTVRLQPAVEHLGHPVLKGHPVRYRQESQDTLGLPDRRWRAKTETCGSPVYQPWLSAWADKSCGAPMGICSPVPSFGRVRCSTDRIMCLARAVVES